MTEVIEAIKSRRTVRKMRDEVPTRQQLEQIIEAATWAPTHHVTEPWRFIVIAGEERRKLGERLSAAYATSAPGDDSMKESALRMERERPLGAPVIIAIILSPKEGGKIVPQEEVVAAGAALQNALLAAHSLGLGTMVRTGPHAYSETIRKFLGMNEKESLLGFIYVGYPVEPARQSKRSPIESKIEWRGS
ncbi:MAG: nitroreductase family protein [Nitrososphaerales archaeon]